MENKMASTFDEVKQHIFNDITEQTANLLDTLTNIWTETFDEDTWIINAKMLPKHVEIFYEDIVNELKNRQNCIKMAISELYTEALDLKISLTSDINLTPNNPLYTQQLHLTDSLSSLKAEFTKRQKNINAILEEQEVLCKDLGKLPREFIEGPILPTQDDLIEFRQYLDDLIVEKQKRHNEFNKIRNDITKLLKKLNTSIVNPDDAAIWNHPNPSLTKTHLSQINNLRESYQTQYNSMHAKIDKMFENLETIWGYFELSGRVITNKFKIIEYNHETFNKIRQELDQWKYQQQSSIQQRVTGMRIEMLQWWDKVLYSESEKRTFSHFGSNSFTCELLNAHEAELKYLKDFYYAHEELFGLIEQRQELLCELQEIEANANDPARLSNRGGYLLEEEKTKIKNSKSIQENESRIFILTEAYHISTNKVFTVYGKPIPLAKKKSPATPCRSYKVRSEFGSADENDYCH